MRSELDSMSSSGKYVSITTSSAHIPSAARLSLRLRALACPLFHEYWRLPATEVGAEMSGDNAPELTGSLPCRLVVPSRPSDLSLVLLS